MIEHVKYTHCDKLLHTAEEIEKNESILCHQTGIKKKGSYDCFYALAYKLRNQSQIPHKYFEIESLLLYNVSLSSDPNRYQEYAVYKRAEDDSYTKVESITVNGPSSVSNLARILMSINKQPISNFVDQIKAYDDMLTGHEFEIFKQRFADFEAAY